MNKPKIFFKSNLGWICLSLWATGLGDTPQRAYSNWLFNRNFLVAIGVPT